MMKNQKFILFLSIILSITSLNAQAQSAATILKNLDNVMYSPKDMTASTKIVLIDKSGKTSSRSAVMKQLGTDTRLFRFTAPSSQAGIATLSLPNDVMYLYMPAFGKERRISSSVKNQKFAGTDFSYEDMEAKPFSDKYNAKLLETTAQYFKLELTPKSKKSPYSKVIIKIHKTNFYPISSEMYDRGKKKIKVSKYTFKKIGKYWNAQEVSMKDLKKNHTTKMIMSNVKYDTGLTKDMFSIRTLKQ